MFANLFNSWRLVRAEKKVKSLLRQGASVYEITQAAERLVHLAERILGEQAAQTVSWIHLLGSLYRETGNPEAEMCLQRAVEGARRVYGPMDPRVAVALCGLAGMNRILGRDLDKAESYYREALSIDKLAYGNRHPETLTDMNNLALLLRERNDLARNDRLEARTMLDYVRSVDLEQYGPNHPIVAEDHGNWSSILAEEGDWEGAEREVRRARYIFEKVCPHKTIKIAGELRGLAAILGAQGKAPEETLDLYQRALAIDECELGPNHPDVGIGLFDLAIAHVRNDDPEEALNLIVRACRIDDRIIGQVFSMSSERQRLAYLHTYQERFGIALSLVSQYLYASSTAMRHGFDLVLRRKAVGAEALGMQRDTVLGGKYPSLKPKLEELTTLRWQIAQQTLGRSESSELQQSQQVLVKLNDQRDRLEAELARQIPEMNLAQRLQAIDRQVAALALPKDAVLLEFTHFDVFDFKARRAFGETQSKPPRYLAFVLPSGEADQVEMIDLGEAEPIDRMIATFRSMITDEEDEGDKRGLGALPSSARRTEGEDVGLRLREAIFDPLLKAIGDHKRLLISPDGNLSRLPFEVLPTADRRRLIDAYRISYLGAGRDVVRFGFKSNRQSARSLVAADPDFDLGAQAMRADGAAGAGRRSCDLKRETMGTFERLPGTRREGENIAAMLKAELWTAGAALDARLKQCQSPRILHLATHGFFLEDQKRDPNDERLGFGSMSLSESGMQRLADARFENPLLRSGLALAGVNSWLEKGELMEEAEDGLLTAEDVSGLDLLDTELVVLSACDTGLGEVRVGEGVFGLRRAFVLAGAKTLVMSLWKVPDDQTRELMEDFYRRILGADGQPPQSRADALREAQLAMKAKHPEAFYWGAFICQGYDGPLAAS
jgi:CHAT domain-containing protein